MLTRKYHPMLKIINNSLLNLPTPSNISYMWNFGSLLGLCLLSQIITGLFLSFHFCSDTTLAFNSIVHISRDINNGWLMRSLHANGASLFFLLMYIHIGRGIYYSSYELKMAWMSGTLIIMILMATAFLGYVLPWGQMSFWGATVITNLLTAIPYVGTSITYWIWGSFSIDNPTLNRFFSLHFILPFILLIMATFHMMFLHETGSSNPMGLSNSIDKIIFHPFFSWKDLLGMLILIIPLLMFIMINPYFLMDPENFMPANPLVTPIHIQPEWYFLFAYAILRSIPNKLGGVIALFLSILILMTFPFSMNNKFSSIHFYPYMKFMFWSFVNLFMILTFMGACPVENPYIFLSQISAMMYFMFFLFMPLM